MTPADLARIHAAAFAPERGWTAAEFADLLAQTHTQLFARSDGFALTRTIAGETELLTLAVDPAAQGRGTARGLLTDWLAQTRAEADTAFLEVAADNVRARHLYTALGFTVSGVRKGYYARGASAAADAVLMTRAST